MFISYVLLLECFSLDHNRFDNIISTHLVGGSSISKSNLGRLQHRHFIEKTLIDLKKKLEINFWDTKYIISFVNL